MPTVQRHQISRQVFNKILAECMEILRKNGFKPQPISTEDTRFADIMEEVCFGFFGDVESMPTPQKPEKPKAPLTQRQLDIMTLECALVFQAEGITDVNYDESLNHIRAMLADMIAAMGYQDPDELCRASTVRWGCYQLWEQVARQDGVDNERIVRYRAWSKENAPTAYEE